MTTDEIILGKVANELGAAQVNKIILEAQLNELKAENNALHVENVALHAECDNAKAEIVRLNTLIPGKGKKLGIDEAVD